MPLANATGFEDVNLSGSLYVNGTEVIDTDGNFVTGLNLEAAAVTTGTAVSLDDADALTTGTIINATSNSSDTNTRTLVIIKNDHASATGATALSVTQDSTANSVFIDHNGATGNALNIDGEQTTANVVDVSAAVLTTGKVLDISDLDAITTGKAIHIDATGVTQTDGILVHLDSASTALTSTGRILLVDHTGNASVSGVIAEIKSAAADETVIAKITGTAALAAGVALDVSLAAMTTGKAIDISDLDAITTGKAIHVDATGVTQTDGILVHIDSASTALTATGRLLLVDHTGNAGVSNINSEFKSAAADETVIVQMLASAALAAGKVLNVSAASMTTGTAIAASDLNALTTGIGVHVASSATAITGAGRLVYSNHTGATGTSAILNEFASAANDETIIAQVTASAALAAGKLLNLSAVAMTTGIGISMPNLDALTTGNAVNIVSNSADTTGRALVYVKNDHASANATNCLELVNDSTLAPIKTTSGAVSTNYFRVGTFNGVTLWVGNGNTANTALSGTAGDLILNAGSNKPEYCTGTTNWTALV